jgi:Alpha/beta hydrolase of unknown function (DUF900).
MDDEFMIAAAMSKRAPRCIARTASLAARSAGAIAPDALIAPSRLEVALYVSPDDKALATAGGLFGGIARLGRLDSTILSADQIAAIASLGAVDIVQRRNLSN